MFLRHVLTENHIYFPTHGTAGYNLCFLPSANGPNS